MWCGFNSKQKKWVSLSRRPHTPPAPVREETKSLKEDARRALQHAVEHRPRVDAGARGQRRSMLGGAESAVAALVGASSGVKMMRWSALLNGGHDELSVHGVHQAARASRGRSGSPKVRVCTRLACGFWPARGRQLAWHRGGLQWRVEVDFPTAVSMLWGHVASCRLTRPRRSLIAWSSVDLLSIFTSFVPNS